MISVFSQAKEIAFDALFNLLPINFSWIDTRGYILGCNQRLLDCLDIRDMGDILGKHMKDFVSDDIWENTRKVIEEGNDIIFEEAHKDKSGNKTYFISAKSLVKSKDGKILGMVIISFDITDRKLMEIELEESKKALQLSTDIKNEFLRNIKHDLQTPFCGIIRNAELLERKEKDLVNKQYLQDMIASLTSISSHINEILTSIQIQSGLYAITEKEFDIQSLLEEVCDMMRSSLKSKELEFNLSIAKDLPPYVIGDMMRLQCILINIITNAIKFTEIGHIHIFVNWVKKSDQKCIIEFLIEDTGIGIPDDKKEAIFEIFSRLNSSSNEGSGLGLNIVKQFLNEIDGQYDVQSTFGKGTTFRVFIPYKLPLINELLEKNNEHILEGLAC